VWFLILEVSFSEDVAIQGICVTLANTEQGTLQVRREPWFVLRLAQIVQSVNLSGKLRKERSNEKKGTRQNGTEVCIASYAHNTGEKNKKSTYLVSSASSCQVFLPQICRLQKTFTSSGLGALHVHVQYRGVIHQRGGWQAQRRGGWQVGQPGRARLQTASCKSWHLRGCLST
jgi:hypothetical protein